MNTIEIEKQITKAGYRCRSIERGVFEVSGESGKPLMRIEVLDGAHGDASELFDGLGECEDCTDKDKEIEALQDTVYEIERLASRHT